MTPKQRAGFALIKERLERDGISPSLQEISDQLRLGSKSGALRIVDALVEAGLITRRPNRARSMALVQVNLSDVPTADLVAELEKRGWHRG